MTEAGRPQDLRKTDQEPLDNIFAEVLTSRVLQMI